MALWAGRFSKEVDETVNAFNSSIAFDARMYAQDIRGSIAHAQMLGKCGIIELSESQAIVEGLKGILADIESSNPEDERYLIQWQHHLVEEADKKATHHTACRA